MGGTGHDLAGYSAGFFARWRELITGLLREAQDQGRLPLRADPAALAGLLVSSLEGGIMMAKAAGDGNVLREIAATALDLVLPPPAGDRREE
ncbi:MAG: hypothetical protein KQJ78_12205 [Deltaproteobacteria bacterium]|nr:hypothetical protein [Deltaproteobacteria bacterium]